MNASPPSPHSDQAGKEVPTCFRHPDREAYVRCTRCDRVICPDCMREASVGFQCVDCVAEGNRGLRQPRTAFGGRVTAAPYVTWTILGIIGVCFLAQQVLPELTYRFAMVGLRGLPDGTVGGVLAGEWYRMLTSAFLHGSIMHLLFNGFAMYVVGPQLERWLGHLRFLALWLLSALGGSVLSYVVEPAQLSVGASGAIFGLFGAIFVIGRRLQLDTRFVLVLLGVNLLITFLVPNIAWTAHIGGLVTGLLLALAYAYLPWGPARGQRRARLRTILHLSVTIACALLLVALTIGWTLLLGG